MSVCSTTRERERAIVCAREMSISTEGMVDMLCIVCVSVTHCTRNANHSNVSRGFRLARISWLIRFLHLLTTDLLPVPGWHGMCTHAAGEARHGELW